MIMNRNTAIGLCLISLGISLIAMVSYFRCDEEKLGFTDQELALIHNSKNGIMRVLTIEDSLDTQILRATSTDIPQEALLSEDYTALCSLMIATVTHPSQDGVGIAGPQVGLNRRIVAVQRFDKKDEPFEVYPNIDIIWASDSLSAGPEGCLSVPGRRGEVLRSKEIVVEYTVPPTSPGEEFVTKRDTVSGFTAVIFQHEIDHLKGTLYIDKL